MASTFALGARTVGDVRVAALKSRSASRGIARATARPVATSLGCVTVRAMPGAVATRGLSLKVAAAADERTEINSRATPARAVDSAEHACSAPAAPAKKFAVPAMAFAAAVATINQADTAWILISTGTSPNARPPGRSRRQIAVSRALFRGGRNARRRRFAGNQPFRDARDPDAKTDRRMTATATATDRPRVTPSPSRT